MGQTSAVPLPEFDFDGQDLIILWTGRTVSILEVRAITVEAIEVHEDVPEMAEAICQMIFAGGYEMYAVPRGLPTVVRWV